MKTKTMMLVVRTMRMMRMMRVIKMMMGNTRRRKGMRNRRSTISDEAHDMPRP